MTRSFSVELLGALLAATYGFAAPACSGDISGPGGAAANASAFPSASPSYTGTGQAQPGAGAATSGLGGGSAGTTSLGNGAAPAQPMGTPGTSLPYTAPDAESAALEARTWKLSHEQYQASIEALLGVRIQLEDANGPRLAPETSNGVFINLSDAGFVSIANGLAEGYMEIAGEVSESVTEQQLASLGDCQTLGGAACTRGSFLTAALSKAFRRPANADDLSLFGELFDAAQAEVAVIGDESFAYRSVLKAMLTSPFFLYRTEIGEDPAQQDFQLTPHEVASFLSYSILGQPPSEQLLSAASTGSLDPSAELGTQVQALLSQPEADAQFERFMIEWLEVEAFLDPDLGLGRDNVKVVPEFDDVKQAMQQETEAFLAANGTLNGTLGALLTAPVQTSDSALAAFYQSEPTGGNAASDRVGIFALGAGLSMRAKDASTSPTLRGLFVRERLMCQHFTVPPGVNPDLTELKAQANPKTTRELYELHAKDPTCNSCHSMFDPLGFTLETFDEVGRFRSSQSGVAIDTHASLVQSDVDQELQNHVDLANALSQSMWVRECLARQAFRYYFGMTTSLKLDAMGTRLDESRGLPPIQQARSALEGAGDLRAMVTALLSSESTHSRTRREPEQL